MWDATDSLLQELGELFRSLEGLEREFKESPKLARKGEKMIGVLPGDDHGFYPVNVIPSGESGPCQPVLLVAIGSHGSDSVKLRILEALEHVQSDACCDITNMVVFWAAKWDAIAWLKHKASFRKASVALKLFGANPTRLN